jgi:tetratricopeptide (TPR) repeat protein
LRKEFPGVREIQQEYAIANNNLGLAYREMKRPGDAAACHRRAVEVFEGLYAKLPSDVANRAGLANAVHGLAVALDDGADYTGAEGAYRAAYELRAKLPESPTTRDGRYRGHRARARALEKLGRYAEAARDWAAAAELAPPAWKPGCLIGRGQCLARAGDPAAAAAATEAGLKATTSPTATHLYDAACTFALCSGAAGVGPADHEAYAGRAADLLGRAVRAGYRDAEHVESDADLDPIRGRADYRAVIGELRRLPPVAPPPRPAGR